MTPRCAASLVSAVAVLLLLAIGRHTRLDNVRPLLGGLLAASPSFLLPSAAFPPRPSAPGRGPDLHASRRSTPATARSPPFRKGAAQRTAVNDGTAAWSEGWYDRGLVDGIASRGDIDGSLAWLRARKGANGTLDVHDFNQLIGVFATKGHVVGCMELFMAMGDAGVEPDVRTYNQVLKAFALDGDADGVMAWFRKMELAGLKPDAVTYNIGLRTFALSDVEGVRAWVRRMELAGVSPSALTSMMTEGMETTDEP